MIYDIIEIRTVAMNRRLGGRSFVRSLIQGTAERTPRYGYIDNMNIYRSSPIQLLLFVAAVSNAKYHLLLHRMISARHRYHEPRSLVNTTSTVCDKCLLWPVYAPIVGMDCVMLTTTGCMTIPLSRLLLLISTTNIHRANA